MLLNNKVIGRGGTDLRAPFNLVLDDPSGRFAALDALIIVTDGYGSVPKQPPSFPVLWLITHGGTNNKWIISFRTSTEPAAPMRFYITHIMGGWGPGSLAPERCST